MIPHFIRPEWFFALLPLGLLLFFLTLHRLQHSNWEDICDAHLLPFLLTTPEQKRSFLPLFLLSFGWIIAVIALAGPSWKNLEVPVYQTENAHVLVFDLSSTMNSTDIPPSRLERGRYKLIDLLKQTTEGQLGLIVFSGEPYVVSPLTYDARTILSMVEDLSSNLMPVQGYDIARALILAQQLLEQAGQKQGNISLITSGPVTDRDLATAKKLYAKGYRISVLGIGTEQGSPIATAEEGYLKDNKGAIIISKLDQHGLEKLASAGGGQYVNFTHDNQDIAYLTQSLQNQHSLTDSKQKASTSTWLDQGQWLALALLPLAALGFRRGWLMGKKS